MVSYITMRSDPKSELQRDIDARANRAGTKQWIIRAAIFEFARYGFDGARIDRIAKSAKVNKAMIYYHFDSKDNLYLEVVTSFYKHIRQQAEETVLPSDTLEDALSALASLHESMFCDHEHVRPMVLRELANPRPEVLDAIAGIFSSAGIPQKIASLIGDGIGKGVYRQVDIAQALVAFVSMSLYYHVMAPFVNRILRIDDPSEFVAERPKAIIDIFLNGLKAR